MTFGSLFAGIGGFDLGFHRAGLECRWQVEKDPDCLRVLAHHWPAVPKLDDVCRAGAHNLERVDVVCFGSPCQDLSVAGKRGGLTGERSGLFHEAARILRELRPAVAVWENVPGAFSSESGRDFRTVLLVLRECGAVDIAWRTLDAQYFGVAQRRRRVFVVADFGGERAGEILFERPCGCGHPPSRGEAEPGTAPSVTPGARRASGNRAGEQLTVSTLTSNGDAHSGFRLGDGQTVAEPEGFQANGSGSFRAAALTLSASDDNGSNQLVAFDKYNQADTGDVAHAIGSGSKKHNNAHTPHVAFGVFSHNGAAKKDHAKETDLASTVDQTGGYAPGQGGTLVAFDWQSGGDVRHNCSETHTSALQASQTPAVGGGLGMTVRRLTPRECERLQGFPDDWTALPRMSDSPRYRMLGNAVCVNVAEWIGRRIIETEV